VGFIYRQERHESCAIDTSCGPMPGAGDPGVLAFFSWKIFDAPVVLKISWIMDNWGWMMLQITSKRLRIYRNRPNGEIVTLISETCVEYDMLNQQRESFMHKEGLF